MTPTVTDLDAEDALPPPRVLLVDDDDVTRTLTAVALRGRGFQIVEAHDGLRRVLEWNTKRGADFQCLAQLVFCCDTLSERANPSAQRLERWLMRQDTPTREFKEDVTDALNELLYIAGAKGLNDAFTLIPQRVAPVEFVFIGTRC